MQQIYSKVTQQLYWNRAIEWVFSCKLVAYFQNNVLENLWRDYFCLCLPDMLLNYNAIMFGALPGK